MDSVGLAPNIMKGVGDGNPVSGCRPETSDEPQHPPRPRPLVGDVKSRPWTSGRQGVGPARRHHPLGLFGYVGGRFISMGFWIMCRKPFFATFFRRKLSRTFGTKKRPGTRSEIMGRVGDCPTAHPSGFRVFVGGAKYQWALES